LEPNQKKNYILLMIGFVAAAVVIVYVFSLRTQLQDVRANQSNYEEKIDSLSSTQNSDALKVNREFLKSFFTYQTTAERYKEIKPFMTDRGYKATHPSGTDLPDTDQSVKSSMVGLKPFEYQSSKTQAEFFNEFKLSTEFNDVTNTETVIVKTSLIFVKEQGWKVDDVEFVGKLTGRE
jgi:type II secretory pathway pseudopilin PulG